MKKTKKSNKEEVGKIVRDEIKFVGIMFAIFYVVFQIHYHKENPLLLLKTVVAHFYLFIIPGYSLCLFFYDSLSKIERAVLGIGVGYGLQPFLAYLINYLTKINMMRYNLYVSLLLIIVGILMFRKKLKK